MAKEQNSNDGDSTKGKRRQRTLVDLPEPLRLSMQAYIDAQELKTTITAVVTAALTRFLKEEGFYPPPAAQPDE